MIMANFTEIHGTQYFYSSKRHCDLNQCCVLDEIFYISWTRHYSNPVLFSLFVFYKLIPKLLNVDWRLRSQASVMFVALLSKYVCMDVRANEVFLT